MEFDGIFGIIIVLAIIGFNIIVPILKKLKEDAEIENPKPVVPQNKPMRNSPHGQYKKTDSSWRKSDSAVPPVDRTFEPIGSYLDFPSTQEEIPTIAYLASKAPKERSLKQEKKIQKELAERLMREKAIAETASGKNFIPGEICDACYDIHPSESEYAAMMKKHDTLVKSIVVSEILGKPLALRGEGGAFDSKF